MTSGLQDPLVSGTAEPTRRAATYFRNVYYVVFNGVRFIFTVIFLIGLASIKQMDLT